MTETDLPNVDPNDALGFGDQADDPTPDEIGPDHPDAVDPDPDAAPVGDE